MWQPQRLGSGCSSQVCTLSLKQVRALLYGLLECVGSGINEERGLGQSRWDLGRHVWEGLLEATLPHSFNLFVLRSEYPEAAVECN